MLNRPTHSQTSENVRNLQENPHLDFTIDHLIFQTLTQFIFCLFSFLRGFLVKFFLDVLKYELTDGLQHLFIQQTCSKNKPRALLKCTQERTQQFLWFLFTSLFDEGNFSILRKKIREYGIISTQIDEAIRRKMKLVLNPLVKGLYHTT